MIGIRAFELERALELAPQLLQDGVVHGHGHDGGDLGHQCTDACHHGAPEAHSHGHAEHVLHSDKEQQRRSAAPEHIHDPRVTSVGFERTGELDLNKANAWISRLLQEKGADIFRMKGVLAMAGSPKKYLFQGVHMMLNGEFVEPWGDMPRVSRLVFIGRHLDRAELTASLDACLATVP